MVMEKYFSSMYISEDLQQFQAGKEPDVATDQTERRVLLAYRDTFQAHFLHRYWLVIE